MRDLLLCFIVMFLTGCCLNDRHEASALADFYVATDGSDNWSGKLPQPNSARSDGPFATPAKARDAIREANRELAKDRRVEIRAGDYYLPQGLQFTTADSGESSHTITYANFPGEEPRLIGGMRITNWQPYKGSIWQADLPAGISPSQLFENGERLEPARAPKTGYFQAEASVDGAKPPAFQYFADDMDPTNWDVADATAFGWPVHDWFSAEGKIESIDSKTRTIRCEQFGGMNPGNRFFIRNVLALLTAPGECHISLSQRKIYVWPKDKNHLADAMVISTAPALILLKGERDRPVRGLHFVGLNLGIADGCIVDSTNTAHCEIRDCIIENAKGHGVLLGGLCQNSIVSGNLVRFNGHNGISLEGPAPGEGDLSFGNAIENNHIHHCGRLIGHGYGISISQSGHNKIQHNNIHHMPRYGITTKGPLLPIRQQKNQKPGDDPYAGHYSHNNLIAYNDVHHVNQDSQDTGAMESWLPGRDNVYDHNYIHDSGNLDFDTQSGIYLDDGSDYWTVTNNIICGINATIGAAPIYAKGIHNRIENNVLVVTGGNNSAIGSFEMADLYVRNHRYERNIIYFEKGPLSKGAFGAGIAGVHSIGDELEYTADVPATGEYSVWVRYALDGGPLDGSFEIRVDGVAGAVMQNLPITGDWNKWAWSKTCSIHLTKGSHKLTWHNNKGGSAVWDAFVFCTDPAWKPQGVPPKQPSAGNHLFVIQSEVFEKKNGQPMAKDKSPYHFVNWSDDRVEASDNNVFYTEDGKIGMSSLPEKPTYEGWRALFGGKFDAHSLIADPQFVDIKSRNFHLKPTSPALALGFKDIDTSEIGLMTDFPKRLKEKE